MKVRAVAFSKWVVGIKRCETYLGLLIMAVLFIAACSQDTETDAAADEDTTPDNKMTGNAAAGILRACKYPDEDFCEDECCKSIERCNGEIAYRECDLETGEWADKTYSDSDCVSECEIPAAGKVIEQEKPGCIEGWKCIDKFQRSYRLSDCSFGETERCRIGCMEDKCTAMCSPGEYSCKNGVLRKCDETGEEWQHYMDCDYGCEGGSCLNSTMPANSTEQTDQPDNQTEEEPEPEQNVCGKICFIVSGLNENPDGDDIANNEYVAIKNTCQFSCDLSGWEVSDLVSHKYEFSSFILGSESEFTLYSGDGTDTESKLYWKRNQAVWNNNGDTIYLRNKEDETMLNCIYTLGFSSIICL